MKSKTDTVSPSSPRDLLDAATSELSRACERKVSATRLFEANPTDENLDAVDSADRAERACQILHAKAQREHEAAVAKAADDARAAQLAELRVAEAKADYAANVDPKRKAIVNQMRALWVSLRALHDQAVDLEAAYHQDRYAAIQLANAAGVESQLLRHGFDPDGRPVGEPVKYNPSGGVLRESFGTVHGNGAFWEAFDRELR